MTTPPPEDVWTVAVHTGVEDFQPIGAGVIAGEHAVLTCAHVVAPGGRVRDPLWLAFPKATGTRQRRRVVRVVTGVPASVADVAVLVLDEAIPRGAAIAPLRFPAPRDLVDRRWWAFGFPGTDPLGGAADGTVGAELGYGWVRLDTRSRYLVEPGFSGAGLWSEDYGAVVALVGQAGVAGEHRGDGRAFTLHEAAQCLPGERLRSFGGWSAATAGGAALAAWGWTLRADPEAARHWLPRARGVSVDSERGFRFRGRAAALGAITAWLDRDTPERRVLVVTGSPGVGKSAVLGRIVTTADAAARRALPPADEAVRATIGSVACAVHAKGKTALDVAVEIARAASAALPAEVEDLAPALRRALDGVGGRFNVVIDALDEASDPGQVRTIVAELALPLVQTCADVGVQVVVGTRRRDHDGDVLGLFGPAAAVLDLDDQAYFAAEDLAAYARACLQLSGGERAGNPYADDAVAGPVADRIAAMSGRNFLVAGLVAREHGLGDERPVAPAELAGTAGVDAALRAYVRRLAPAGQVPAADALTALAFAEAPGWSARLWSVVAGALAGPVTERQLLRFARSSAANFLVETGEGGTFRLFHQALDDALRRARAEFTDPLEDERTIARALIADGRAAGWANAEAYLLRSLPAHGERAGLIDELLTDDSYLLHADLRRLVAAAPRATTPAGIRRARLLRLTPFAAGRPPAERVGLFGVTAASEGFGTGFAAGEPAAYRARWAAVRPRVEHTVLDANEYEVNQVCSFRLAGQVLLASAGDDGLVRLWDPVTGSAVREIEDHPGMVLAVCAIGTPADGLLLATAGDDGVIRLWDPHSGILRRSMTSHDGHVYALATVEAGGTVLLASAGDDDAVRLWEPSGGGLLRELRGHDAWIHGLCAVPLDGSTRLASAGRDGTVRLWEPESGRELLVLRGHTAPVYSVCPLVLDGAPMLASASDDSTVRLWDLRSGACRTVMKGRRGGTNAVAAVSVNGTSMLAAAAADSNVNLWQAETGVLRRTLRGHALAVSALTTVESEGRTLLVSAGSDGTVRLWDPGATSTDAPSGRRPADSVRRLHVQGDSWLAAVRGARTVQIRRPADGALERTLTAPTGWLSGLGELRHDGRSFVAVTTSDGAIRSWDPSTGAPGPALETGHRDAYRVIFFTRDDRTFVAFPEPRRVTVRDAVTGEVVHTVDCPGEIDAMCVAPPPGPPLLGIASESEVLLCDPASGAAPRVLGQDSRWVSAICMFRVGDRTIVAIGDQRLRVQLWNAGTGVLMRELTGHGSLINQLCPVEIGGRVLLASASEDRTVGLWDARDGDLLTCIPVHHPVRSCAAHGSTLVIGSTAGPLAIDLFDEVLR